MEASSHPEFVTAATQDDLLDEMSLQTVLDMLAVMVTAEELSQLESLTPEQKRQVWFSTPEDVKLRLKRIKALAQAESPPPERSIEELAELKESEKSEEPDKLGELEKLADLADSEDSEDSEELDELNEMGAIADADSESINLTNLPLFQSSYGSDLSLVSQTIAQTVQVGDSVVLKAEPRLTAAELVAVWRIVAIQGEQARVEAKGLGNRQYPMSWMVSYPLDEPEF
ncbi:MAG: hypothetical protein HC781_02475 [Leptolyngbyaceae cyanobacterium CSU_1_4]|nr:hypothetical protein [Leptolyngbyaceae cyanobacterium CSU_1_4]